MNRSDDDRVRHAMFSFAVLGGMLVTPRHKPTRVESAPRRFVPFFPRKPRDD